MANATHFALAYTLSGQGPDAEIIRLNKYQTNDPAVIAREVTTFNLQALENGNPLVLPIGINAVGNCVLEGDWNSSQKASYIAEEYNMLTKIDRDPNRDFYVTAKSASYRQERIAAGAAFLFKRPQPAVTAQPESRPELQLVTIGDVDIALDIGGDPEATLPHPTRSFRRPGTAPVSGTRTASHRPKLGS